MRPLLVLCVCHPRQSLRAPLSARAPSRQNDGDMDTPQPMLDHLRQVGVRAASVWDLVNRPNDYDAAIPVLIEWLERAEAIVPDRDDHARLLEGIARALTIPGARGAAAPALIREFRALPKKYSHERWAIGNAIHATATRQVLPDLLALAADQEDDFARHRLVCALARFRGPETEQVLLRLLDDPVVEVVQEAALALGRWRLTSASPKLESLLTHPNQIARRAATRALRQIAKPPRSVSAPASHN